MTGEEVSNLARSYVAEMRNGSLEDVAWEQIDSLIDNNPIDAWGVLVAAVEASTDAFLHQIGAGPLETLLNHRPDFFEQAIRHARRDARFREAFRYVRGVEVPTQWLDGYDELWRSEAER